MHTIKTMSASTHTNVGRVSVLGGALCIFSALCMCKGESPKPKFTYYRHQRWICQQDAAVFPAANAGLKCTLSEVKEGEEEKILPEHASTDTAHIVCVDIQYSTQCASHVACERTCL